MIQLNFQFQIEIFMMLCNNFYIQTSNKQLFLIRIKYKFYEHQF